MENKTFTKKEFDSATNELVKIARESIDKGFSSSISLFKDHTTICIFDADSNVIVMFSLNRKRYVDKKECKELINAIERENITIKGKYMQMIIENYKKGIGTDYYVLF